MLLNLLAAELSFLRSLSHPGLLRFYGASVMQPPALHPSLDQVELPFEPGAPCVAMVFEVAREGCLESRVARTRRAVDHILAGGGPGGGGGGEGQEAREAAAAAHAARLFPWAVRVRAVRDAAAALDFMHCQDIVHRDIKPAK